jgi:hypothetical protein
VWSTSPSSSHVTVCSPMCGCGPMPIAPGPVPPAGPKWSTKHHAPIVRRPLVGRARRTGVPPRSTVRDARRSKVGGVGTSPSASVGGPSAPVIGPLTTGSRSAARRRRGGPGRSARSRRSRRSRSHGVARPHHATLRGEPTPARCRGCRGTRVAVRGAGRVNARSHRPPALAGPPIRTIIERAVPSRPTSARTTHPCRAPMGHHGVQPARGPPVRVVVRSCAGVRHAGGERCSLPEVRRRP